MTMDEFSKKYGIPYPEVQRASFRTALRQSYGGRAYGLDFEERDLKQAVRTEMERRIQIHLETVTKAQQILVRLNGGGSI